MAKVDGSFLAAMEDVLDVYSRCYDPACPVVCFDERPCFLIADTMAPIPTQSGRIAKEHYGYEKNGSCCLLAAIEPLSGKRIARVYEQRTKKQYTQFMQVLAQTYPQASKIIVVQDNLNTHHTGSFYEHLPAAEAKALAGRFQFHYTPKGASWLNMIEIEFSALSRLCLNRRIGTKEMLQEQIACIVDERNKKQIKINWQFSIADARKTLNKKYAAVNEVNNKLKII